jgi:sugar lactone lactonase YvrE
VFDLASGFRCNDGKCDPRGRFWAGTVTSDFNQGLGQLYRWNLDGSVDVMVEGLYISNGLGWSPDQRWMYLSDSYLGEIYRFSYDAETGDIANRTLWLQYDGPGVPDGLTVDSEGFIWTAVWDGQCVLRLSPEGEVVETIDMPVQRPTSCILGGDNLQTLYVTSSSRDITDPDQLILPPPNGGLYSMSVSVPGLPENMSRVNVMSCTVCGGKATRREAR